MVNRGDRLDSLDGNFDGAKNGRMSDRAFLGGILEGSRKKVLHQQVDGHIRSRAFMVSRDLGKS